MPPEDAPIRVPPLLAGAAAWCWRILVVAAAFLALVMLLGKLELLVLPLLAGVLFSALLYPAVALLCRAGVRRGWATTVVLVTAFLILGMVATFVVNSASNEYPKLVNQVSDVSDQVKSYLVTHLHINERDVTNVTDKLVTTLRKHQSQIASGVVQAGRTFLEWVSAAVLTFFITFFFLFDGHTIWGWVVDRFPQGAREPLSGAGNRAWRALTGYVAGTFLVALFQGTVIGITLALLGVPLVGPLAVLTFLGSFIPIIGAVVFGALAVLVALVTSGWVAGLVVVVVLIGQNQVEAHLLQPLVVGRYVHLHPLAIAVTLAGGALLAGLPGAIFGVPIVAAVNAGVGYLRGDAPMEPAPYAPVEQGE